MILIVNNFSLAAMMNQFLDAPMPHRTFLSSITSIGLQSMLVAVTYLFTNVFLGAIIA